MFAILLAASTGRAQQEPTKDQPPAPADRPAIPSLEVGPTLPTIPVRQGPAGPNDHVIDATPLPSDKAPQLDYADQKANFALGQTVTGADSGATGVVLADLDLGTDGTLTLGEVKGEFKEGENILDASGGSATVSRPLREGVWVLDFSYKPLRMRTLEIPGVGRRSILYLYYKIVNHTHKPRMLVPQFDLVTDDGKKYPDRVMHDDVLEVIQAREDPRRKLLGAVSVNGVIPPSERQGIDDTVFGVAIWVMDDTIRKADSLSIYVRGLSDGLKVTQPPDGGDRQVSYKTLRLDFSRPGDEHNANEREIRPKDPANEWIYY